MGEHGTDTRRNGRVGIGSALRVRLFALLYIAETQSIVGDQIARVALSILVFDETGSASATAGIYAATLLPAIVGGLFLSRFGDRFPRRAVMIACDVVRGSCFAVMAIPGVPLGVVVALLVFAVFFGPVFSAAQVSYLASRLPPDTFRAGNALRMVSTQSAQVGGFVFGGLVVAVLSPRVALLLDAISFAASVVLIALAERRGGRERAARHDDGSSAGEHAATVEVEGFDGIWNDRRLRALVALALLAGFFVVPEGLAVPFGDSVDAETWQVGMLLAAGAAGGATGALAVLRFVRSRREVVAGTMAALCGLPLIAAAVSPNWQLAALGWLVSGIFAAYLVEVTTMIVQSIPDGRRAHLIGIVGSLLLASQGIGLVTFGALAQVVAPDVSIAIAGAIGSALALGLLMGPLRAADAARGPRPVSRGAHRSRRVTSQ